MNEKNVTHKCWNYYLIAKKLKVISGITGNSMAMTLIFAMCILKFISHKNKILLM